MTRSFLLPFAAFTAALVFAQPALSSNMRWLEYSPVRFFTNKDWEIAKEAARTALNDKTDGETVSWKNPETGNYGSLTPLTTVTKKGMKCRLLHIMNHANNLDGQAKYEFCQKPDGKWKAATSLPQ